MSPFLQDQSSKLEAQLSSATERLSSSQSDIAQLRQQVASAERRAEDKEASSLQTQEKFSAIFDSLRADHEKVGGYGRRVGRGVAVMNSVDAHPQSKASLEERYCVLSEQLMSTKEALARSEVEANGHQMECERLRQELSSMKEAHSELEETLQATEEAYHEVERERKDMETLAKETEEKVRSLKTPGLLNCSAKLHVVSYPLSLLLGDPPSGCCSGGFAGGGWSTGTGPTTAGGQPSAVPFPRPGEHSECPEREEYHNRAKGENIV